MGAPAGRFLFPWKKGEEPVCQFGQRPGGTWTNLLKLNLVKNITSYILPIAKIAVPPYNNGAATKRNPSSAAASFYFLSFLCNPTLRPSGAGSGCFFDQRDHCSQKHPTGMFLMGSPRGTLAPARRAFQLQTAVAVCHQKTRRPSSRVPPSVQGERLPSFFFYRKKKEAKKKAPSGKVLRSLRGATGALPLDPATLWKGWTETLPAFGPGI